jgi:hypothetical protein
MFQYYKSSQDEIVKLKNEISQLKKPSIQSYVSSDKRSYSEFVVLVKSQEDKKIDIKKNLFDKVKSIENEIDIMHSKKRNDTLVVHVRNAEQQKKICDELKDDELIKCEMPKKKIPSIRIKEIEPGYDKKCLLDELEIKEEIKKEDTVVKVILANKNFRT